MDTQQEHLRDDLKRRALTLSGLAFTRIRSLSEHEAAPDMPTSERIKLIKALADGAHNLPQLVAEFGNSTWATADTLLAECGLCEEVLTQTSQL